MTWNFRLVKHTERKPRRVWYGVHEMFYDDAGRPWTMTEEPVSVDGESRKDVLGYLTMIQRDLARLPILDAQKIRWAKPPFDIRRRGTKTPQAATDAWRRYRGFLKLRKRTHQVMRPLRGPHPDPRY